MFLSAAWAQAEETADSQDPHGMVDKMSSTILNVIMDRGIDRYEKNTRILTAVEKLFDYELMARLSIGPRWQEMTATQQTDYLALFTERVKRVYLGTLYSFTRNDIVVGPATQLSKQCVAVSTLLVNRGIQTEVVYKMYHGKSDDDTWRVYDLKIEGVSMVEAYRADFSSYLGTGCATGFIEKLREYQPD